MFLFIFTAGSVGYSLKGLRYYVAQKSMNGQSAMVLSMALGIYGGYFFGAKIFVPVAVSVTTAAQPKYIPITHIFDKKEVWKVASTFELVEGSLSLYVAEAHRPGERNDLHRLVFLDIRSCLGAELQRIPRIGEDVSVMSLDVRVSGGSNIVTQEPMSVMAFVKPPCQ